MSYLFLLGTLQYVLQFHSSKPVSWVDFTDCGWADSSPGVINNFTTHIKLEQIHYWLCLPNWIFFQRMSIRKISLGAIMENEAWRQGSRIKQPLQYCRGDRPRMTNADGKKGLSVHFPSKNTRVGCHFLLQRVFPTQGSNQMSCIGRQILLLLNHQGSPQTSCIALILELDLWCHWLPLVSYCFYVVFFCMRCN